MKNSGSGTRRDTYHGFDLVREDAEVVDDLSDAVARDEADGEVLDTSTPCTTSGSPNATSGSTTTSA